MDGGIKAFVDSSLDGIKWRWADDLRTDEKLLFVSEELEIQLSKGNIPDELADEIKSISNGGSV